MTATTAPEQIGTVELLRTRIYPLTPGEDVANIDTATVFVQPGTYPVYRDSKHYWWQVVGTVNQRGIEQISDTLAFATLGDKPSNEPVGVRSEKFDETRFAQLLNHGVCREGDPIQAMRFTLRGGTEPSPAAAHPQLLDDADTAWTLASEHVNAHTDARHRLAAVLLRQRWPTVATVMADMTGQISTDERSNPSLHQLHDPAGILLATLTECDELTDAVEEQLGKVFDFADGPEGAGWNPVPATGQQGVFDHYVLDLPPTDQPE